MKLRNFVFALILLFPVSAMAGGWSNWAVPTRIDVERDNGFMVFGSFGNAENCDVSNRVYVPVTHPQYDKIYSMALAAFTAEKELMLYVNKCDFVGWYSGQNKTYNYSTVSSVNIRNKS